MKIFSALWEILEMNVHAYSYCLEMELEAEV